MKYLTTIILALATFNAPAEEISNITREEIHEIYSIWPPPINIPSLVRMSEFAGVGKFINIPTESNNVVDIDVQQWWTANPGTNNQIRIYELNHNETDWVFPTNVPIVFFADTVSNLFPFGKYSGSGMDPLRYMSEEEKGQLWFREGDRSWFRVSRDNGLVHSFTTNLWQHVRTNPNITNQYEILRDAYMLTQFEQSWRVLGDACDGLLSFYKTAPENFLVKMRNDPLLDDGIKSIVYDELWRNFGWDEDANGVFRAPDTAAMRFAASNFTAQALAVWRTHDTNNIISFAQNAVATNATPEALLFRGIVACHLENDVDAATNIVYSADQMVYTNNLYTARQKALFKRLIALFYVAHLDSESIMYGSYTFNIKTYFLPSSMGDQSLEGFMNEHSSEGSIFEKFGGEFPFSEALKVLYNRE